MDNKDGSNINKKYIKNTPKLAKRHTNTLPGAAITTDKGSQQMMGTTKNNTLNIDKLRPTPGLAYNINTHNKQTTILLQQAISSSFRKGLNLKVGTLYAAVGN